MLAVVDVKDWLSVLKAFNVINGGSHAGNKLAMQEFMILPVGEYGGGWMEEMKLMDTWLV